MEELNKILEKYINGKYKNDDTFSMLGLDSFGIICMVNEIEETFNIEIPDEELKKIYTINDVKKLYKKITKNKKA